MPEPRDHDRAAGVTAILGALLLAAVLGTATPTLARDQLHLSCSYGAPGTEGAGSWTCADGVSYLWIGVLLGGITLFLAVGGAAVAARRRHSLGVRVALTAFAALGVLAGAGITAQASDRLVFSAPAGRDGFGYWVDAVLPAAVVAAVGVVVAVVALFLRGRRAAGVSFVGAGLLGVAPAVQPGLAISMAVPAALVFAAALRAADPGPAQPDVAGRPAP